MTTSVLPKAGSTNLALATQAIRTTRVKLSTGVSNSVSNLWRTKGSSAFCVSGVRKQIDEVKHSLTPYANVRALAGFATTARCGNCEEHAFVAFLELKRLGVQNVEIWRFSNGDHVFVVIGRASGTPQDPSSWGQDAVICDAWKNEAYPAADLSKHWPGKRVMPYYQGL